jgi:hypothetical protein
MCWNVWESWLGFLILIRTRERKDVFSGRLDDISHNLDKWDVGYGFEEIVAL